MTRHYIPCNLCGSQDSTIVYASKLDEKHFDANLTGVFHSSGSDKLEDQVVRCNDCGLIFINPVLEESIVLHAYKEGADPVFVSQNKGREKTFRVALRYVENQSVKKGILLDVGAAGGAFCKVARDAGWSIEACEPNTWLCESAQEQYDVDISCGTIFDLDYQLGSFDVITLWDVLEHTSNPKAVLARCNDLLTDDGCLVLSIPDIGSWIAKLLRRSWPFLLSVHLFYFDKKTINSMLEATGFHVTKFYPYYQFLELDYIIERIKPYWPSLARMAGYFARATKLNQMLTPYWLGQTLVLSRKNISLNDSNHNEELTKSPSDNVSS